MAVSTLTEDTTLTRRAIGQGVYSLKDLRAFVAFEGERKEGKLVPSWLDSALNPVPHERWQPDYSFSDLISLFVVRELRRMGHPIRDIRTAEAHFRTKWLKDRPFASDDIWSDGRVISDREELVPGQIEAAHRPGQQVMLEVVKDRLVNVRYDGGWAAYWIPMENVLVDPRVQFGEPVVSDTRVTTDVLADAVRHFGIEKASRRLDVTLPAARSALAFEDKLASVRA